MPLSVGEVINVTGGKLCCEGAEAFSGFIIDSRKASPGDLFIPLPGEKTDGHRFIAAALQKGAAGALLDKSRMNLLQEAPVPSGKTLICVDNVMQAMHRIALLNRQKYSLPVIAVTGSNGKTTTKDMIASVLSSGYNVLKTEDNLNNHLGLPLMLLRLEDNHEAAVLEMGMSGFGEIALLASLALPSFGVITNIGEAHLASLGSRENIARAKNELLVAMGAKGKAFLNGDDPYLRRMGKMFPGEVCYYGFEEWADLRVLEFFSSDDGLKFGVQTSDGAAEEYRLPYPGKHNVYNALAAIAVGKHFGIRTQEIKKGLADTRFAPMRMEKHQAKGGFRIINDAYNASPASMKAALHTLLDQKGNNKSMAILGDMLELGELAEESHMQIGRYLAGLSTDYLVTVGKLAALIAEGARDAGYPQKKIFEAKDTCEAVEHLRSLELKGYCLLLKGSRDMHMEQIAEDLLKQIKN